MPTEKEPDYDKMQENTTILESVVAELESTLASLQAENEKLWKLLEREVKELVIRDAFNSTMEYDRGRDDAWDAFQKANDLTQNKK